MQFEVLAEVLFCESDGRVLGGMGVGGGAVLREWAGC